MLVPVPTKYRKRSAQPKIRPQTTPPLGLLVTSVVLGTSNTQLVVTFNGSITWDGVGAPAEFKATTSDGPDQSCIGIVDFTADSITVEFNGEIEVGATWEVTGALTGISPAVAWPQSGNVE